MGKKRKVAKSERVSFRWDLATSKAVVELAEACGWSESRAASFLVHVAFKALASSEECVAGERDAVECWRAATAVKRKAAADVSKARVELRDRLRKALPREEPGPF